MRDICSQIDVSELHHYTLEAVHSLQEIQHNQRFLIRSTDREFFEVPIDPQNRCHKDRIYRRRFDSDIPATPRYMAIHSSSTPRLQFHFQTEFSN